jgi:hypothetical protein
MGDEVFGAALVCVAYCALDSVRQSIQLKILLMISEITKLVPTKIDVMKNDSDQVGIRNPNAGKIRKLSDMATRNVIALLVASSITDALMDCITPPSR